MTQKLTIPIKYPKWMQPLNEFLTQKETRQESRNNIVFLQISESWPEFVSKCGKTKPVKTKEEKEAAKAAKIEKQTKNKALWEAIANSGNADTNLRRFAVNYKDRLAAEQEQERSAKKRRRQEEEEEEEEEMQEDAEEEEEEDGEEAEEVEEEGEAEEGEEEEEEVEEEEEEEVEEEEEEKVKEEKEEKHNARQTIQEQLQKKVPIKELEKDKTEFYSIIAEYGIGVDEKVAKLFNRMFERAVSQTKALDTIQNALE